ncbi:MAG: hypothetical protein AAF828_06990 [Bacteroidota bacterium]
MRFSVALTCTLLFATIPFADWEGLATLKSQTTTISTEDLIELEEMEDTLGLLAYTILHDSMEENRFLACRAMIPRLVNALKTPNSFQYPFEQLQYISIQYPPDSSFRVFTWQLFVNRDEYRYYGAIQMNSEKLKLFPLIDRSFEVPDEQLENASFGQDKWYGYVVYDIQPVQTKTENYYLLFGADSYRAYQRRKIVDVLSFSELNGKPAFGKDIFLDVDQETGEVQRVRNRLVQQFSAESYVTTKYDADQQMIMLENLVGVAGRNGEGMVNIPDGSYRGYKLSTKDGRWYEVDKVFNHTYQEAPRTKGSEVKRDIFGRRQ